MRCALVVPVLLLAGCPKKSTAPVTTTAQPGVGCPAASAVYVASYVQPPEGEQGHTGWVLPLHDAEVASVEGTAPFATIDVATATAAGMPAPPAQEVWLMPPNAPMCKATVGRAYAAAIDVPTPNVAYGVELTGCPAPRDEGDAVAIALVSAQPPTECQALAPKPVAARLGTTDDKGTWSRPTKETPIPPAFAKVVPQKDCVAPACETLWSVAQVDVGGAPVAWAGAVNWLRIPAGSPSSEQCAWPVETFSGFFVAGADGTPTQITEGQDHPLLLTAVLADKGGAKALLATGVGEYATYDLGNGAATLARHLVWLIDHPESYGQLDRLGPDCGL